MPTAQLRIPSVRTEGLETALERKEQQSRHRKVDGTVEAHMITIAYSETPEGRDHDIIDDRDEFICLGVVDSISDTDVMNILKKRTQALSENGVVYPETRSRIRSKDGVCTGCI